MNPNESTSAPVDKEYTMKDEIEMTISISEKGHLSNNLLILFNNKLQEENARLRSLIEKAYNSAYMTGYFDGSYKSRDTSAAQVEWEQFKKDNNL